MIKMGREQRKNEPWIKTDGASIGCVYASAASSQQKRQYKHTIFVGADGVCACAFAHTRTQSISIEIYTYVLFVRFGIALPLPFVTHIHIFSESYRCSEKETHTF